MATASPPSTAQQFLADLAERVITTFLQSFLAALLATSATNLPQIGAVVRVSWFAAAMIALMAAAVSFLTTVLSWLTRFGPITNPYLDLAYRAVLTFGQTLLGSLAAAGAISALQFNWNAALLAAIVATGQSLLKALIGVANRRTAGASVFVPAAPTPHRPLPAAA